MHGLGTDIITISRIVHWVNDEAIINYVFTENEKLSALNKKPPHKYLAAFFAAKEAFLKAVGIGWGSGVEWKDIEVVIKNGTLSINLYNRAKELCNGKRVFVSTSSAGDSVIAMVVIDDKK